MSGWRLIWVALAMLPAGCDETPAERQQVTATARQDTTTPEVAILQSDAISVEGTRATYTNNEGGRAVRVDFAVPADQVDPTYYHATERLGVVGDVIAVLDTYGSGVAGATRCAETGREAWVRAFSLATQRQIGAELVSSCVNRIAAGDPPVTWQGDGFRTTGAAARMFRVDADGIKEAGHGG